MVYTSLYISLYASLCTRVGYPPYYASLCIPGIHHPGIPLYTTLGTPPLYLPGHMYVGAATGGV